VREAPFESAFGWAFGADYVAGRGVLMRYLTEASVRPYVGAAFDGAIAATAAAVWTTRTVASNQFQAGWVRGDDSAFQSHFKSLWGEGDVGVTWSRPAEDPASPIIGILQAAGLDAVGAAIDRA